MKTTALSDAAWRFQPPGPRRWLPAAVPGCIHTDLLRHGLIADPFHGRNELHLQWIEERDWIYRCDFTVAAEVLQEDHVELVFEGLDTFAQVTLNGKPILASDNMFHRHRLAVKPLLRRGRNRLQIVFGSALAAIRSTRTEFSTEESNDPVGGRYRVRKQQCQFGWDWGPRFVTAGVWRPVQLQAWSSNRIESVRIVQQHGGDGSVSLSALPELAHDDPQAVFRVLASLAGRAVTDVTATAARLAGISIPSPQLWWPAGQGGQPLYTVRVDLLSGAGALAGTVVDTWQQRVGLRTIVLDQADDGLGAAEGDRPSSTRFGLRVNGRLIFAKGANWVPAHSFVAGLTRADYLPLLQAAKAAHMNTIRLWGGGVYEHEAFYEQCDELGLLVWHDHLFACCRYPADEAFLASVRREVADQVRRIRHHACLALWCGDNEILMLNQPALQQPVHQAEYLKLFFEAIPQVLRELDPQTPYLHSSPGYAVPGQPHEQANTQPPSHDEHDWQVWHARKPVEHYEGTRHRFVSEFGMQSYPSLPVARSFCPPGELNVFSPTFQNHQKNTGGNSTILDYTLRLYRLPADYAMLAWLSQLNQAWCMKVAVEHFRRSQPHTLGALYWQLNDCWPVASWSSLEFGGRWKAVHFAARRFFAPALVSARHLGQETVTLGNYPRNTKGAVEIWTSSDAPQASHAQLEWTLLQLDGAVLAQGGQRVRLRPLESVLHKTLDFTKTLDKVGRGRAVLRLRLHDEKTGALLSENTVLFTAPRCMSFSRRAVRTSWKAVKSTFRGGTWDLRLSSPGFQHGVGLEFDDPRVSTSDNAFDLFAGEPRVVRVTAPGSEPPVLALRLPGQV